MSKFLPPGAVSASISNINAITDAGTMATPGPAAPDLASGSTNDLG